MKPTPQESRQAIEETKPFRKLALARLPHEHVKRELRGAVITEHADGKGMDIHDPTPDKRYLKRLYDMQSEYRALDYDIGQESQLRTFPECDREGVRNKDGSIDILPGGTAEAVAKKKGLRPVIRWGRPRHRTVERNGLYRVYHAEPGGALVLVRAYRLADNGDRTSREIEVPIHGD